MVAVFLFSDKIRQNMIDYIKYNAIKGGNNYELQKNLKTNSAGK